MNRAYSQREGEKEREQMETFDGNIQKERENNLPRES